MEERPQIWMIVGNILKNICGHPTRCGPPAWGLGEMLTTPHRKNLSYDEPLKKGLGHGLIL
jgi:hypothetical protein